MIRQWQVKDSVRLRELIRGYLTSQNFLGGDVAPTERNINHYLLCGFEQIRKNNDPHLVWEEDGDLLGYIQLGKVEGSFDRFHKTCEVFAMYVKPGQEHRFIGTQLFQACMPYMQKNGYTRAYSMVIASNRRMLDNMFINPAIWPTKIFLEWDVRNDEQFTDEGIKPLERR